MITYLTKIKFTDDRGIDYGYQETSSPTSRELIRLYNEDGDQLENLNRTWEALSHTSYIEDSDDFWNAIESMRFAT